MVHHYLQIKLIKAIKNPGLVGVLVYIIFVLIS